MCTVFDSFSPPQKHIDHTHGIHLLLAVETEELTGVRAVGCDTPVLLALLCFQGTSFFCEGAMINNIDMSRVHVIVLKRIDM